MSTEQLDEVNPFAGEEEQTPFQSEPLDEPLQTPQIATDTAPTSSYPVDPYPAAEPAQAESSAQGEQRVRSGSTTSSIQQPQNQIQASSLRINLICTALSEALTRA